MVMADALSSMHSWDKKAKEEEKRQKEVIKGDPAIINAVSGLRYSLLQLSILPCLYA